MATQRSKLGAATIAKLDKIPIEITGDYFPELKITYHIDDNLVGEVTGIDRKLDALLSLLGYEFDGCGLNSTTNTRDLAYRYSACPPRICAIVPNDLSDEPLAETLEIIINQRLVDLLRVVL